MRDQVTGRMAEDGCGTRAVDKLPYGELAVALCASDMPTARSRPSQAQIAAWASQGLARLGGDEVWRRDYRTRLAQQGTAARDAVFGELWPDLRRFQTAHDIAWRYLAARKADGSTWPVSPAVLADVADMSGAVWDATLSERDLEHIRRCGLGNAEVVLTWG